MKAPPPTIANLALLLSAPVSAEIVQKTSTFIITQPEVARTDYGIAMLPPSMLSEHRHLQHPHS